jgi:uncharacterized protein
MRIILWLLLGVLVILALKKKARDMQSRAYQSRSEMGPASAPSAAPAHTVKDAEDMVSCAHCQLYVPVSDAVLRGELHFCSVAHADQHTH